MTVTENDYAKPFNDGYDAYARGLGTEANPYDPGERCDDWDAWEDGWATAKLDVKVSGAGINQCFLQESRTLGQRICSRGGMRTMKNEHIPVIRKAIKWMTFLSFAAAGCLFFLLNGKEPWQAPVAWALCLTGFLLFALAINLEASSWLDSHCQDGHFPTKKDADCP